MGKIKQFKTFLICTCVGRPAEHTGTSETGGRIQCGRTLQIPISDGGPTSLATGLIKKQTQPFLDKAGWKKLKTLGYFQRLCPSCSEHVIARRAGDKETWG